MHYFGDKSLFILGRNDMDTRELFQQINPEFLRAIKEHQQITTSNVKFKELTDKADKPLKIAHFPPYDPKYLNKFKHIVPPKLKKMLYEKFDGVHLAR